MMGTHAGRYRAPRLVGDIVYRPYLARQVGKVIEETRLNGPVSSRDQKIVVRWADGRVTRCNGTDVLRLDDLIEEHISKAEEHSLRRDQAQREIAP